MLNSITLVLIKTLKELVLECIECGDLDKKSRFNHLISLNTSKKMKKEEVFSERIKFIPCYK